MFHRDDVVGENVWIRQIVHLMDFMDFIIKLYMCIMFSAIYTSLVLSIAQNVVRNSCRPVAREQTYCNVIIRTMRENISIILKIENNKIRNRIIQNNS